MQSRIDCDGPAMGSRCVAHTQPATALTSSDIRSSDCQPAGVMLDPNHSVLIAALSKCASMRLMMAPLLPDTGCPCALRYTFSCTTWRIMGAKVSLSTTQD